MLSEFVSFSGLNSSIVGPEPAKLVALTREAIDLAATELRPHESLDDIVGAGQQAVYAEAENKSRRNLLTIARAAQAHRKLTPPQPSDADFATVLTRQPWLGNVDHHASALQRLFVPPAGVPAEDHHARIAAAIELLATAPLALEPGEAGGRPTGWGPARIAVRASYFYRWAHGLPLSVGWDYPSARRQRRDPDNDTVLAPTTDAARLACAIVVALGINADMNAVKHHLQHYVDELRDGGRKPSLSDFVAPWDLPCSKGQLPRWLRKPSGSQ